MSFELLEKRLLKRKDQDLFRSLPITNDLIDLTSNDYFGFSRSFEILHTAHKMTDQIGATGSRLLTGNHFLYRELEERIAVFHRAESCLIYNTGYMANLGLLAAIGTEETTFIYDLEVHASIYDGMRLSHAKCVPFRHNNLESLERKLRHAIPPTFVIIESIYSISGDFAPIQEIVSLCTTWGAYLIIDEAHATGVCGPLGEGRVVECNIEHQVFARIHTFSKALGVHGAAVLGSEMLVHYLVNFSRPFIYTTALPPSTLAMIACAYERLEKDAKQHQAHLKQLIQYFRSTSPSNSPNTGPIQTLYFSGVEKVKTLSKKLLQAGLDIRAIVPPTTSRGHECLRIVLHSFNRTEEIDQLLSVIV